MDIGQEILGSLLRIALQVQSEAPAPRTAQDVARLQAWRKLQRGLEGVLEHEYNGRETPPEAHGSD